MKKLYLKLLTCLGLLVSTPVLAEDSPIEFSANVGYFSDYIYRGGSQTADGAAIQGGFDMSHESGFYIGCHPYLTNNEVTFVLEAFKNFFQKYWKIC